MLIDRLFVSSGCGLFVVGGLRKASWLEELDDLVEGTVDGAFRIFGAVAEGDDGGDGFFARDLEEGAEAIGITHAHDQRIEAHGAGGQDQIAVAQAVVVRTPEITELVGLLTAEKA